jgi:two-component system, OmpR family, alkaline phosphatase synthesis response regulator PhoP
MSDRILLVEDEENLSDLIRLNLEMEGYEVNPCATGTRGAELALNEKFDLVLLDVMLPGINGFDILAQIRKKKPDLPVLILTARGTGEDRITGLKLGADDYLVKPFNLEELMLRVKNLLSRVRKTQSVTPLDSGEYSFGPFKINFETYEILKNGKVQGTLTNREVLLLKLLTSKAGQVVSREEILDKIWGEDAFPSSRTIDNYILALRKYFEVNQKEPVHFHSIRGVGYKFTP